MPTTNPVPSYDPTDLLFNAQKLDEVVNSASATYADRLGATRRTLAGLEAEFPNAAANAAAAAASAVDAAEAAQIAQDEAVVAIAQASAADASRVAAETARDAAMLSAGVYATTAAGLEATTTGRYFSVPSANNAEYLILYRNESGVAVDTLKRYPSADAVNKPSWAGKINGWPDQFFRHLEIRGSLNGRQRWYMANSSTDATLSLVAGSAFNGNVLRRSADAGNVNVGGPRIYIDEIGAAPGDMVTIRALLVGSGASVVFAARAMNAAGGVLGTQQTAIVTAGASPVLASITFTLPADTNSVITYPFTNTAGQSFDVIALWSYKGTAASGPDWPLFGDDEFFDLRISEIDASVIENTTGLASLSRAVDTVTTGTRTDSIAVTLGTTVANTEADGFTGFGQTFTTPITFSSNACYIGGIPRGATTKKWSNIKVVLRTHATDPAAAGSTVVAVGEITVDPDTAPLGTLYIPWRDPSTDALKTVTQADLQAQYGVMFQAWVDDSIKATVGQQRATSITGASKLTSYYVTTADARTGGWAPYSANPSFAIAAVGFDSISQADAYFLSEPAKNEVISGLDVPPRLPYADTGRLRRFRSVAYRRMQPTPETGLRVVLGLIGDSWSTSVSYFSQRLARSLVAKLGDGGVGWVGLGFTGSTMTLDARGLYFLDSPLTNWTSNYHNGSTSPNISDARSSTAGALLKIANVTGATHPSLSAVKLHFTGTADGVIRWRWNGGAWSANTNVQGSVGAQQTLDMTGFPTSALSSAAGRTIALEIEVVSGSVILCGVDFQSATDGIVIHKLGSSGSKASDWVTSATAEWRAAIAALGLNTAQVLLGTNDQAAAVPAATFAGQMGTICTAMKTAVPSLDVLFTVPPENPAGYATPMSSYATAMVSQAITSQAALLNLQAAFGDATNPAEYASGGTIPLFVDSAHPNAVGAGIVAGEIERVLLWR